KAAKPPRKLSSFATLRLCASLSHHSPLTYSTLTLPEGPLTLALSRTPGSFRGKPLARRGGAAPAPGRTRPLFEKPGRRLPNGAPSGGRGPGENSETRWGSRPEHSPNP